MPEVTLVLGNLVFQHEMVSECVPGQLRNGAVILMLVVLSMGEHHVGRHPRLSFSNASLISSAMNGK